MSGAISSVCMTQQGLTASDFGAAGRKRKKFFSGKKGLKGGAVKHPLLWTEKTEKARRRQ